MNNIIGGFVSSASDLSAMVIYFPSPCRDGNPVVKE